MSEKMLVTQALDERDLLVKKISDKIEKASFVDTIKPNEEKVYAGRCGKEEFAKDAQAAYLASFKHKNNTLKLCSQQPKMNFGDLHNYIRFYL